MEYEYPGGIASHRDSETTQVLNLDWLLGVQKAQFALAEKWRNRVIVGQAVVAVSALLSVPIDEHVALYVLGGTALLGGIIIVAGSSKQRESRAIAERSRRTYLLVDGLGRTLSGDELLDIWDKQTARDADVESSIDRRYYASSETPGPTRFGEILKQSAYWTCFLQRRSASIASRIFLLSLLIILGGAALATVLDHSDWRILTSRCVLALAAAVMTQGLFESVKGHREASSGSERVYLRLQAVAAHGYPEAELLSLFEDYNAMVQAAPLPFPGVYRCHRARLNAEWEALLQHAEAVAPLFVVPETEQTTA